MSAFNPKQTLGDKQQATGLENVLAVTLGCKFGRLTGGGWSA
jgi:hypothetical protein